HVERMARLADMLGHDGLDGAIVGVGPDLEYLTGYQAVPLERLTCLTIGGPSSEPVLFVPRLELDAARAGVRPDLRIETWEETDELAQFAIVASGPNAASPHHQPSDRVIQPGEPIVLDIGGTLGGYNSDTTRTLWVTGADDAKGPTEDFRHLFAVLLAAHNAATVAVRPGVAAEAIDRTARDI